MPTSHPLAGEHDPESLWTCPYNPSHRVAHKRIQFHLTKCRKNHPNAKKELCPFNATHMVNEQEFQFHLEVCSSKGIIDNFKYKTTPSENHVIELPPEPVIPPAEENWDNDYSGTYEPTLKVFEAPLIHSFIGGTRSERKKCRVLQRQKFRALEESAPAIKVEPKDVEKKHLPDDQPLRQPTSLPPGFANDTAKFASLNRSCASGISEIGGASSSKQEKKPRGVLDNERRESTAAKLRNSVAGTAWGQSRPGSSQDCEDDGFRVFKPKGRGKFLD